jgi:hypothetical protein
MIKIDKDRMDEALKSPRFTIPNNLDREQLRQFLINNAKLTIVTNNYIVKRFTREEVLEYLRLSQSE